MDFEDEEERIHTSRVISLRKCLRSSMPENDFCTTGTMDTLPVITIGGKHVCSLPFTESVAREVIVHCEETPFGMGENTVFDKSVRNGWQVTRDKLTVGFDEWLKLEQDSSESNVLEAVRGALAPNCAKISSELYKLLVYEEGNHFKTHKDTQRSDRHFATLLVFLPSVYEGGDLVVRHKGEERRLNFSMDKTRSTSCHFVAFFTDCDHEVEPVTSGHRVNLQYNLSFEGEHTPAPPDKDVSKALEKRLDTLFNDEQFKDDGRDSVGFFCSHHYTSESMKPMYLKGEDSYVFHALQQSAKYSVELVPVEIEARGLQEYSREWPSGDSALYFLCIQDSAEIAVSLPCVTAFNT